MQIDILQYFVEKPMAREPIPEDIQRFILMTVPSAPCLEAMSLLHNEPLRK